MKPRRTDEEKRAWRETMRKLVKEVAELPDAQRAHLAERSPIITCEGHPLSVFNTCFLLMQSQQPAVTVIGGYRQWTRAGEHYHPATADELDTFFYGADVVDAFERGGRSE